MNKNLSSKNKNLFTEYEQGNYDKQITEMCEKYKHNNINPVQGHADRIIVLGDIHGDYNLMLRMLKVGKVINDSGKWIGKNTIVVQVGDQIDRYRPNLRASISNIRYHMYDGDENRDVDIMKYFNELHKKAQKDGGQVISLLGNHELMNSLQIMDYVSYQGIVGFANKNKSSKSHSNNSSDACSSCCSSCSSSMSASASISSSNNFSKGLEERKASFRPGNGRKQDDNGYNQMWRLLGCSRLSCVVIGSNMFVHAGIIDEFARNMKHMGLSEDSTKNVKLLNKIVQLWLLGIISANNNNILNKILLDNNSLFWTRLLGQMPSNTKKKDICAKHMSESFKVFGYQNIIIGHTPQSFGIADGINGICEDTVWRVDCGSSVAFDALDTLSTSKTKNSGRVAQVLEITHNFKTGVDKFTVLKE